ncbi:hypothetical protein V8E53_008781 [Lactarius tabidus]
MLTPASRNHRSIAPDGGRLSWVARTLSGAAVVVVERVVAPFRVACPPPVLALALVLVLSASASLLMANFVKTAVEKRVGYAPAGATSEPKDSHASAPSTLSRDPPLDASMDVDATPPHPPSSLSASEVLPFPGRLVDSVHEVKYREIGTHLTKQELVGLCETYHLTRTGNKDTLIKKLKAFSADQKGWNSLGPGARNKHRGPRVGGITKGAKKGTTKLSTLRRELLFGSTIDGTGSTSGPCHPDERPDPRTDAERAELLVWADECVERNSHYGPKHPLYKPPLPGPITDAAAHANADSGNPPTSMVSNDSSDLAEKLRLLQARFDELVLRVESGTIVPSAATATPAADIAVSPSAGAATIARDASSVIPSAAAVGVGVTASPTEVPPPSSVTPLRVAGVSEQIPALATSTPGPPLHIELANGRKLRFLKQSIPNPPPFSFVKDIPLLVRMWDDGSSKWNPLEAVLHIQGEPIALKYWQLLYRYSGQWTGIKKNWGNWQEIVTSWHGLSEVGFWKKFSSDKGPMSYTAITENLQLERIAADRHDAAKAKEEYGAGFDAAFTYRRGGGHFVMSKDVAIAKQYRTLQQQSE